METMNKEGLADTFKALWVASAHTSKQLNNGLSCVHGIGLSEYMVLDSLMNAQTQTLPRIDLANRIGKTASAITKMLAPMEKIGLVEKEAGARDARVSLVKLTKAGERVFKESSKTMERNAETVFEGLDNNQRSELLSLLQQIRV